MLVASISFIIGTILSCNRASAEMSDTILTETVEVTYQNSDIDTFEVLRNEDIPYRLIQGDLEACKDIMKKGHSYRNYVVCSGVRSYKVLESNK